LDTKNSRKGSLIKRILERDECVFISFDLEHGGDQCGITQLSAVLFRLGSKPNDPESIQVFNEYVRPPKSAKWNPICIETTGLHAGHPSIVNADAVEQVWGRFNTFLQKLLV